MMLCKWHEWTDALRPQHVGSPAATGDGGPLEQHSLVAALCLLQTAARAVADHKHALHVRRILPCQALIPAASPIVHAFIAFLGMKDCSSPRHV